MPVDAKQNERVIRIFTFSVTQEITNSGSNGAQTDCFKWFDKSPKAYVRKQIN